MSDKVQEVKIVTSVPNPIVIAHGPLPPKPLKAEMFPTGWWYGMVPLCMVVCPLMIIIHLGS